LSTATDIMTAHARAKRAEEQAERRRIRDERQQQALRAKTSAQAKELLRQVACYQQATDTIRRYERLHHYKRWALAASAGLFFGLLALGAPVASAIAGSATELADGVGDLRWNLVVGGWVGVGVTGFVALMNMEGTPNEHVEIRELEHDVRTVIDLHGLRTAKELLAGAPPSITTRELHELLETAKRYTRR